MNIVLVILDSLRKDCIGAYGQSPWGPVRTPSMDALAMESVVFTRAYPEVLPTLPARRALFTGKRVYPFHDSQFQLKGDFVGAPGWGPIPEDHATLAERLSEAGYRTGLVTDTYHMFKPSKNFARGFDQWTFLRGQETDPARSGPRLTPSEVDHWLPQELQSPHRVAFIQQCITNLRDREREEDYFAPRVFQEAAAWLEQNRDAEQFFLVVDSFDPHEPWLVPPHYLEKYADAEGREQVISPYGDVSGWDPALVERTRANYSGAVTLCDHWFGMFLDRMRELDLMDDTLIILAADHGHSIGDRGYMGKRGYPSAPEVVEVPLMVRYPGARHAGISSDLFVQHVDIAAEILHAAGVGGGDELDGHPFLDRAVRGGVALRDHVTVGWDAAVTVVTDRWWFNAKVDGTGIFLYDLGSADPFAGNVGDQHPSVVRELFDLAEADARGGFPDWLLALARDGTVAPGCSDLAARS